MAKLIEELFIKISAKPDASLNQTLEDTKKKVKEVSGEITDIASKSSFAFGALSVSVGFLVKSWLDAAGAMEQYEAKLTTVLKSATEAKATIKEAVEFAQKTPFEVKDIVNATVQLEVYGQKAKKWLPLVGDLAAGMGKELGYTSQVIGKALTGSSEGFESLRNELGITTAKLVQYGAVMGETGGISLKTTADLEKAQQALQAIIKTEFGGAMERQANTWQGAMSNLNDSISKLQVAMGEALIPTFTAAARTIIKFVESLDKIPKPIKDMVAFSVVAAGAMGGLGMAVTGLIAILPSLAAGISLVASSMAFHNIVALLTTKITLGMVFASLAAAKSFLFQGITLTGLSAGLKTAAVSATAFTKTMAASIGVSGLVTGGLALAAVALALYTSHMEEQTQKLKDEIAKQEKALKAARLASRQYADKTGADLFKAGTTVKELKENMDELAAGAEDAFQRGDKAQEKFYRSLMLKTEQAIEVLKVFEQEYKSLIITIEDVVANYEVMGKAEIFKNAKEESVFLSNEIDRLIVLIDQFNGKLGIKTEFFDTRDVRSLQKALIDGQKEINELERKKSADGVTEKEKLALEQTVKYKKQLLSVVEKQIKNLKKADDEQLSNSKTFIQRKKDLNQISLSDEIKANERMLAQVKGDSVKEAEIRHTIATLRYKLAGEAKDKVEQALKDELDTVKDMTSGQVAEYDKLIKKIKEYISLKKIDTKDGQKLVKTAEKEKKTAGQADTKKTEKETKDEYDRIEKVQKSALDLMGKNEEKGVYDRIRAINTYIRYWENEERKRPALKKEIEEKITELTKDRANIEADIIQANRDAEKDLRQMRLESLNYEISQLEEKFSAGEDVEAKFMEKIKQRHKLEIQNIKEQVEEWRKKGVTQEKIEEKTAFLKQQLHQKDLQQIDDLIQKLKAKNAEEKQEEKKTSGVMTVEEAFGGGKGFATAGEEAKKRRERQEAIESLESEKARIEAEKAKIDAKIQEQEKIIAGSGDGAVKDLAEKSKETLEKQKEGMENGNQSPESVFASAVDVFASAVSVIASVIQGGKSVTDEQYEASRGGQAGEKKSAGGQGINITVKLEGGKGGSQGVTAQADSQGNVKMSISRDVLATARGEVSPVGQTAFQSLGGNSILGFGVGAAFG